MDNVIVNKRKARAPWLASVLGSAGVLLAVLLVASALVGYKFWQVAQMAGQGPPPEVPTAVSLEIARPITFRLESTAIGTVVAPRSIILSNEVPGTVSRVQLVPGAVVEAGTVLVELDSSVELAQLEAAIAIAKMAKSRYQRTWEAQRNNALTEAELEEAEGQSAQADARVEELKAIIQRKQLVAPFPARVGLSDTHEGQYLPSGTEITSLQSVEGYLYIDFALPQHVANSVQIGQSVSLDSGGQTYAAVVEALDSRTDRLTRNLMTRARLDASPAFMKPGDSVKVRIEFGQQISGVAIPTESIRRTPTGAQVFVAVPDEQGQLRAARRVVEVQKSIGDQAVVFSGIQAGDAIVTTGSFKLLDGGLLNAATASQSVGIAETSQL